MLSGMQKNPKRPRDPNQLGKLIVDMSVGEVVASHETDTKDPSAVALGQKGGKARAAKLSKKQRVEIAQKAARQRWKAKK
jgi:hypothetical protein